MSHGQNSNTKKFFPKKLSARNVFCETAKLIRKQWAKILVSGSALFLCTFGFFKGIEYLNDNTEISTKPLVLCFLLWLVLGGGAVGCGFLTLSKKSKCGEFMRWRDLFPAKEILRRIWSFLGWGMLFGAALLVSVMIIFVLASSIVFGGLPLPICFLFILYLAYFIGLVYSLARWGAIPLILLEKNYGLGKALSYNRALRRGNVWRIMRILGGSTLFFGMGIVCPIVFLAAAFGAPWMVIEWSVLVGSHTVYILTLLAGCEIYLQLGENLDARISSEPPPIPNQF